MSHTPTLRVPVIAQGRITGHVELVGALRLRDLPVHLRSLGYRITTALQGRIALERLH